VAAALRADVLKVAHHGSRTSSTAEFVGRVRPRLALVSVGAGNGYGHPSPAVLERWRRAGAQVLRTDAEGAVVARTDGMRVWAVTAGGTWNVESTGGPPPTAP
jgi:competence protein ComEC